MTRCSATTLKGCKCKNNAVENRVCWTHGLKELNECGVCLDESLKTSKSNVFLNCGHIFCKDCIYRWLIETPACPNCRTEVSQTTNYRALSWGVANDYLYTPKIICYNTNQLDRFNEFQCSLIFKKNIIFTDEQFKLLDRIIGTDLFEKLNMISVSSWAAIKKDSIAGNPLVIHIFI